ncbi:nucleoside hydrolase [Mobiluncus mulieris]|uniref:uridine-preferring nucleoside hydrolase UriH n=1 Tax=Mobiluncus mulieris TaxID=2052 RepID=UPI0014708346|nr:nucleoside hydrolase [Mobiluncus mulieris]NMW76104.1 nucleoside hydrolase [Mobiluncus mulieris]
MVRKIILDCDPGHDDALALMLAHGNPEIELLAVTTVGGNQTLFKVTDNARRIATLIGMHDVPIAAGCERPLVRTLEFETPPYGETGLDGVILPEPAPLVEQHAVDLIIDTVMSHAPGEVTLVPTGPLTNIAMAVRKEPRIVNRVKEVVLMGGGYHVGNWSAVAEFNIKIDPEAAHIVFNEPWEVLMVGLDLTYQALATDEIAVRIQGLGGSIASFVLDLFKFFHKAYQNEPSFEYPPVHDPCTVAYVIDPKVMDTVRVPIDVELSGSLTTGMTVADFRAPAESNCHTRTGTKLDFDRFWDLVIDAIDRIQQNIKKGI